MQFAHISKLRLRVYLHLHSPLAFASFCRLCLHWNHMPLPPFCSLVGALHNVHLPVVTSTVARAVRFRVCELSRRRVPDQTTATTSSSLGADSSCAGGLSLIAITRPRPRPCACASASAKDSSTSAMAQDEGSIWSACGRRCLW